MTATSRPRFLWVALLGLGTTACGGAAPLMHTAHALTEDEMTVGAGFSGSINVSPPEQGPENVAEAAVEEASVSPGFAPWVGARLGLGGEYDAGLLYTARSVRADLRRSFPFGEEDSLAFSVGLGASGLLPKRRDDLGVRVGGFGGDIPLLFGYRSDADIYSFYLGPRVGMEYLNGQLELPSDPLDPTIGGNDSIRGWHAQAGGLLGLRIGFRYVYAAFELAGDMHWSQATIGDVDASFSVFAIRPAAALLGRF